MTNVLVATQNTVYVLVDDRAAFDKIDRPARDNGPNQNGHVITKTVEQDGVLVIFQHWMES